MFLTAVDCVPHAHYKLSTSACPATCVDPDAGKSCSEREIEGCECSEGTVLDGNKCVPEDQCGCRYNGQIYEVGPLLNQTELAHSGNEDCMDITNLSF